MDVFYRVLLGVFEPESVLSHDILEGGFLRAGFVSDVQVADGFPGREGAYLDRMHRWVRGDWQNLPFLIRRKNRKGGKRAARWAHLPVGSFLITYAAPLRRFQRCSA